MAAADDALKNANKNLDDLIKKQKLLNKSTEELSDNWSAISSQLFQIDKVSFFKDVKKSPKDIEAIGEKIIQLQGEFKLLGNEFSKALSEKNLNGTWTKAGFMRKRLVDAFNAAKVASMSLNSSTIEGIENTRKTQEEYQKKLTTYWDILKKNNKELATFSDNEAEKIFEQIASGIKYEDILLKTGDAGRAILAAMTKNKSETIILSKKMGLAADSVGELKKSATETTKEFAGWKDVISQATKSIGKNIIGNLISTMNEFDSVLHKTQRDTGVLMDSFAHEEAFSKLITDVNQFGVSAEKAGEIFSNIADQLNTTDFSLLSKATKDIAMVEGATGAASSSISDMTGEMMRMGASSEQVHDAFQDTADVAKKFGVSSKKTIEGIAKHLKEFKSMGFQGGEASLARMVAKTERLRMDTKEIMIFAEKARTIEGSMEAAASIQLAGGGFSNVNPMTMLAAARKSPEELVKILTSMGKDIGKFNKDDKFEIDAIDSDRLRIVAEATGVSIDSLRNGIEKTAEDAQKLAGISEDVFSNAAMGAKDWDADMAKSTLADMMEKTKDGKIIMKTESVDLFKQAGITDLKNINDTQLKKLMELKNAEKVTIEEQNKNNQTLKESFDNLMKGFMSIFTIFQPVLDFLGKVLREVGAIFAKMPDWGKDIVAGLTAVALLFSTGMLKGSASLIESLRTKGLGGTIKDKMLRKLGVGGKKEGETTDLASKAEGPKPGVGDGLKSLAEGLGKMGTTPGVLKGIGAVFLAGPAFLFFIPALPGLLIMAAVGAMGKLIELGFGAISKGLGLMGENLTNIAKGAGAMFLIGLSIIPFAYALMVLKDVDFMSVLKALGVLALVVVALIGLGALIALPVIGELLMIGIATLIAIGAGLLIASAGLLLAGLAFNQLAKVDWSGFSGMGIALLSVVPGMLAFSLAAMMFMNPLALLGIIFMVGALTSLAAVMIPLAMSLDLGATSLDRFASGLEKLGAAADKLSLDKLEKLKELGDSFANSNGGAAMAALANVGNVAGGAGGGEKTIKVEVDLKLNGRTIQTILTDGKVGSTHNV